MHDTMIDSGGIGESGLVEPLRWLHLSDIHVGCQDEPYWRQAHDDFLTDVIAKARRLGGPPDLILITGDLTNSGQTGEYERFDGFLDKLLDRLAKDLGALPPLIIPVPGNHDLVRPQGAASRPYRILRDMVRGNDDPDIKLLREDVWDRQDTSFFDPLFENYLTWLGTSITPRLVSSANANVSVHCSHFPGDISVRIALSGRPAITVVGLNSAWMQCSDGDYLGKIELFVEQFHAAWGPAPLTSPDQPDALLLMHHPLEWFSVPSMKHFKGLVYPTRPLLRFRACLHGHMHTADAETITKAGGQARSFFQAPSLFGREHYGTASETRAIGYAWGELTKLGGVRVWPLRYEPRGDGSSSFGFDPAFHDGGDPWDGVVLCEPRAPEPPRPVPTSRPATQTEQPYAPDWLETYTSWARQTFTDISLIGVNGGTIRMNLENVYVALDIAHRPDDRSFNKGGGHARAEQTISLDGIFAAAEEGHRVAIFGDPGTGKTTALRKLLHLCLNPGDGPEALGLARNTVPVFLRLRRFTTDLLREPAPLAAFIERELAEMAGDKLPSDLARRLWDQGNLLLLFDGLDEIADDDRRIAVSAYLDCSFGEWRNKGIRAVVSCRFAGYDGERVKLADRFLHLEMQPLNDAQTKDFVRQWFRHAYVIQERGGTADADAKADGLLEDLKGVSHGSQRIKVLVATPLMLTLLCLLALRDGRIPHRRVEFYDDCLKVLLQRWDKVDHELNPLLDLPTALAVLRPLAWYLHREKKGRELSAAEAVDLIESRLVELAVTTNGFDVLNWLCDRTGVVADYGDDLYGFMHLGFQEYLAAAHVAAARQAHLGDLVDQAGEDWWREVVLLLAGMADRDLFGALAGHLLETVTESGRGPLLRQCLDEALNPDMKPFLDRLSPETDPGIQEEVLRLLVGRTDTALREKAQALVGNRNERVSNLAGRFLVPDGPPNPDGKAFDMLLVHHIDDKPRVQALSDKHARQGRKIWSGDQPWFTKNVLQRVCKEVATVVVLTGATPPWSNNQQVLSGLAILGRHDVRLVVVRLPEAGDDTNLPDALHGAVTVGWEDDPMASPQPASEGVGTSPPRVTGRVLISHPGIDIPLVSIPAGEFFMGSTDGDEDERPTHPVRVSAFLLGETPVTNRQYGTFLASSKHAEPKFWRDRRFSDPDQPVAGVSWKDAGAFCAWLSMVSGQSYRLPSEAEWEYACRAGGTGSWCFGDDEDRIVEYAWFNKNSGGRPNPVGTLRANAFGLYDMHGNVWEWVEDCWNGAYEGAPADATAWTTGDCDRRVVRGGSWGSDPRFLRSAYRIRYVTGFRDLNLGFRLARTLP